MNHVVAARETYRYARLRFVSPAQVWRFVATIAALGLSFAFLLPLTWMVFASFRSVGDLSTYPPTLAPHTWTISNYIEVFSRLPLLRLYVNTTVFAGSVTVASLVLDSMSGYALARLRFRGNSLVFIAVVTLLMVPFQVTLVPLFLLIHSIGLVNTLPGLILPRLTNAFGIFFMRQFFLSLPTDLEDAARVDGASELRILWKIVVPLSRPALLTLGLFHFQANWNDLLWPLIMTSSTDAYTLPVGLSLFNGVTTHVDPGVVMAGSALSLIPVTLIFLLMQKAFVEAVATTGIK